MSTWKTARSRWSRPLRSAMARASASWLSAPAWTSTSSGVLPLARAASIASSTRSRGASPSSTMTSVRKRGPPGRARGGVIPFQPSAADRSTASASPAAVAGGTGRRWGWSGFMSAGEGPHARAASRMTCTGAARPVQPSKLSAPCCTRISRPSITCDPRRRASCASTVPPVPVDQVDHARVFTDGIGLHGQFLERARRIGEPDRGAVDEHLGGHRRRRPPRRRARPPARGRARACGSTPRRRRPPAPARRPRPAREPPAPRIERACAGGGRRGPRAAPGRRCCRPRWRRRARSVSVLAAPIARGAAAVASSASASAASLCGIVTLAPAKPAAGQGAHGLGEELGRDRQALVAPAVEPDRAQRGVVHRRRAAVGDRPAEDAEPGQAQGPTPPRRSTAMCTTTPGGGRPSAGTSPRARGRCGPGAAAARALPPPRFARGRGRRGTP